MMIIMIRCSPEEGKRSLFGAGSHVAVGLKSGARGEEYGAHERGADGRLFAESL